MPKSHKSNFLKLEFGWYNNSKLRALRRDQGPIYVLEYLMLATSMAEARERVLIPAGYRGHAGNLDISLKDFEKLLPILEEFGLLSKVASPEGYTIERVNDRLDEINAFSEAQKVRSAARWDGHTKSSPDSRNPASPRVSRRISSGTPAGIPNQSGQDSFGYPNINKDLVNNTLSTPSPKPLPLLSQDSGTEAVEIGTYLTAKLGRHATPDEMAQEYDRRRMLKRQSLQPKADPDPGVKAERSSLLNIPGMAEAVKAEKRKRQRKPKLSDDDPFGDSFGAS